MTGVYASWWAAVRRSTRIAIQAQPPSRRWRRIAGLAFSLLIIVAGARGSPVWASAFNELMGQGMVILRGTFDRGSQSFDRGGHLIKTPTYEKREGSVYIDYGVTDWLQAIVKPDLVSTRLGGTPGGRYTGFGTSEAGAQVRLLLFGPAVLAVQGTFHLPATTQQRNPALIGNTSRDTDGRALLGVVFNLGSWPSFLDAEAGYRIRGAHAPDEIHLDLTLGTRPVPRVLLLLQSFTSVPIAPGVAFFPRSSYSNLEGSVVYDLDLHWSVQLAAFTTIDGRNALRENGLETSLWYRF